MSQVAQIYDLSFIKKERVAKDTYSFYFERPSVSEYLPGQFMRLTLKLPEPSVRGNGRFFSLASAPSERDYLMITVRTSPQIYKKTLLSLETGEKVQISFPYGQFILKPEQSVPHVFLAGGIGITPFRSMVIFASDSDLSIPITLFTSFKTASDVVFRQELQTIADKKPWFNMVETITQPDLSSQEWKGNTGRINIDLIKKNVTDVASSIFYIAGPPIMVDELGMLLIKTGILESQIRKERFTGY